MARDDGTLQGRLAGVPDDGDLDAMERELAWLRQQTGLAASTTGPYQGLDSAAAEMARAELEQVRSALSQLPDAEARLPGLLAAVDRLNATQRGPIILAAVVLLVVVVVLLGKAMM